MNAKDFVSTLYSTDGAIGNDIEYMNSIGVDA
jgi:hypothetical protein